MVLTKGIPHLPWLFSFFFFLATASPVLANNPDVIKASHHDVSLPLSRMIIGAASNAGGSNGQTSAARATGAMITNPNSDPVAAPFAGPLTGVTSGLNFDGQSAQDNRDVYGAVGATQFVQMVNVTIAVYDKSSGALQLGPAAIHTLWTGFGSLCEFGGGTPTFSDGGDPVVLYDHLASRWLVSQLQYDSTFTHAAQCVAVSTSSDATGTYNRYEFDFARTFLTIRSSEFGQMRTTTASMSSRLTALPARRRVPLTATRCSPEHPRARFVSSSRPQFPACCRPTTTVAHCRPRDRQITISVSLIPPT
jgi:hypothetical protein